MELKVSEERNTIESVRALSSIGRDISVEADLFVIAAGGIETPRLLLLSDNRTGQAVGNQYGLVGRYFMEHPHVASGVVLADDDADRPVTLLGYSRDAGGLYEIRYALNPTVARVHGIGHLSVGFQRSRNNEMHTVRRRKPIPARWSGAYLLHGMRTRSVPPGMGRHLWTIIKDLPSLIKRGNEPPTHGATLDRMVTLAVVSEQIPNSSSRVTLGRQRDELGRPVPVLDWRLSGQDVETLKVAQRILLGELEPLGFSLLHDSISHLDPKLPSGRHYPGGFHHMGTTRMHHNPRHGVVDPQCRVHGTNNLFIAGSGVFPTSGYANPTMTILALALRLVEHLERQLRPTTIAPDLDTYFR